jgi:hypothetical protein
MRHADAGYNPSALLPRPPRKSPSHFIVALPVISGVTPQRPHNVDQIGLGSQPLGLDHATTFPSLFFVSTVGQPAVVAPIASPSGFVAASTLPVLGDAVEPCCESNGEQARQPGS